MIRVDGRGNIQLLEASKRKPIAKVDGFAFTKAILLELSKVRRIRLWRQNVGLVRKADGGMFKAGAPTGAADLTGIIAPRGTRLEIEVKGEGDVHRPKQKTWQRFIESMGGIYILACYDRRMTMKDNVSCVLGDIARRTV